MRGEDALGYLTSLNTSPENRSRLYSAMSGSL